MSKIKARKKDELGSRMKDFYESRTKHSLVRNSYTVLRLDGKAFHTYTRGLNRPFDIGLMEDMDETAKVLCENIQGAKLAFVQSDEISIIVTDFDSKNSDSWFDGNLAKIQSVSASMASAHFNHFRLFRNYESDFKLDKYSKLAYFDSRAMVIPTYEEVVNYLIWRQQDCTKNSISMAAQAFFPHEELHLKTGKEMQEMLWSKHGINWNDYPDGFKRGRTVVRRLELKDISFVHKTTKKPSLAKNVERYSWNIESPSIFTRDREYLEKIIPRQ